MTTITETSSDGDYFNIEMACIRLKDLKDRYMYQLTIGEPMGDFYPEVQNSSCRIIVNENKIQEISEE